MIFPLSFAEAATTMDPAFTSLVALATTLGPTGASIVVLWFCLDHMKREGKATRESMGEERQKDREATGALIAQLRSDGDRRETAIRDLVNQQGELMREFSRSSGGICRFTPIQVAPPRRHSS